LSGLWDKILQHLVGVTEIRQKSQSNIFSIDANRRYREKAIERIVVEVKKSSKELYKQETKLRGVDLMELFRRGVDKYRAQQNHLTK